MTPKVSARQDRDSSEFPYVESVSSTSTSLILQMQNDDAEAWNRFMTLYVPLIRYWCRKPGGGRLKRTDRQDITQDVLVKVSRAIKDFDVHRTNRSLRAWLRTITENTISDFFEKNEKRRDISRLLSDTGHIKETFRPFFLDSDDPGERVVLMRQVLKMLENRFSEKQWAIFNLYVNASNSSASVADIMQMKPDTVRKIKNRMLKIIRETYEKLGLGETPPTS